MGTSTVLKTSTCVALFGIGIYQILHCPTWWAYTPSYLFAALVSLFPRPDSRLWRLASAVSIVGGGLLMMFLAWTFTGLSDVISLELSEGKALLPVSLGVALATATRLGIDKTQTPMQYVRSSILVVLLLSSLICIVLSSKYYQTAVTVHQ